MQKACYISFKEVSALSYCNYKAECVLESMAKLHAHFWNTPQSNEPRGGFWPLQKRLKYGGELLFSHLCIPVSGRFFLWYVIPRCVGLGWELPITTTFRQKKHSLILLLFDSEAFKTCENKKKYLLIVFCPLLWLLEIDRPADFVYKHVTTLAGLISVLRHVAPKPTIFISF